MLIGGLPHAMYMAMFHCTICKTLVWAIGYILLISPKLRGLDICRSSSSKVVVGNGNLNSIVHNMVGFVVEGHILPIVNLPFTKNAG